MADKMVVSNVVQPLVSTGDRTSPDQINDQFKGGQVIVRQTAQGSTDAFVSVTLQGKVPGTTGTYYTLATITPATSTAWSKRLKVFPGASTALDSTGLQLSPAPYAVNDYWPSIWRIKSTCVTANAVTYQVAVELYGF